MDKREESPNEDDSKNLGKDIEKPKEDVEIFKKIRYNTISDEEILKWIKNE